MIMMMMTIVLTMKDTCPTNEPLGPIDLQFVLSP